MVAAGLPVTGIAARAPLLRAAYPQAVILVSGRTLLEQDHALNVGESDPATVDRLKTAALDISAVGLVVGGGAGVRVDDLYSNQVLIRGPAQE